MQLQTFIREKRVDIDYHKSRTLGKQDEWLQTLSKQAVGYDYKERKVTTTEQTGKKKLYTENTDRACEVMMHQ